MAEIWMYFHKAQKTVGCNGCAYETPNTRDSPAHVDTLWAHLSSAHRDVFERSNHFGTLGSTTSSFPTKKVFQSPSNLPSEVWSYFEKVGGGRVRCMLCSRELTHKKNGRTSDLWQHLKSRHIEAYQTTDYAKARTEVSFNWQMQGAYGAHNGLFLHPPGTHDSGQHSLGLGPLFVLKKIFGVLDRTSTHRSGSVRF